MSGSPDIVYFYWDHAYDVHLYLFAASCLAGWLLSIAIEKHSARKSRSSGTYGD